MDEDSELGDFDPQNDSEAQPEEQQPNQMGVPHLRSSRSDHDRTIRPGDVCRDIWGSSWVIAIEKRADTLAEYDEQQPDGKPSLLSYEGSVGVGATEEDAVWACFYVNSNNTLAGGRSGPYDFPESRIVRYAYDSTDGWEFGRFQDHIIEDVLEQIAAAAIEEGSTDTLDTVQFVMEQAFGVAQMKDAFELAEASGGSDV